MRVHVSCHQHQLTQKRSASRDTVCNGCGYSLSGEGQVAPVSGFERCCTVCYECRPCNFDLCQICAELYCHPTTGTSVNFRSHVSISCCSATNGRDASGASRSVWQRRCEGRSDVGCSRRPTRTLLQGPRRMFAVYSQLSVALFSLPCSLRLTRATSASSSSSFATTHSVSLAADERIGVRLCTSLLRSKTGRCSH